MSLDRLESGFLLFDTPQGLVRVELSFWQRVYLLWTFRNFHQLSLPLLNPRQRALVNAVFLNHVGTVSHAYDPLLVIGVVEKFAPRTPPAAVLAQKEVRQAPELVRSSSPRVAWSGLGTTLAALSLCAISVAAWHRIQRIPGSRAPNQPRLQQVSATVSQSASDSEKPAVVADRPAATTPAATAPLPVAVPNTIVKPASITAVIPVPKRVIPTRTAASTPNLPVSESDTHIHASRPPLRFVYPVYPDVPARGVVTLTAQVDSDGAVRSVEVVSGNRALAAAALRAVRQWRYRPYFKDGQPIATETNIVISFISDDAISMSFPPTVPASH